MKQLWNLIFISIFMIFLFFPPLLSLMTGAESKQLNGVQADKLSELKEQGAIAISGLFGGETQQSLDTLLQENYPGRTPMIRLRNQFLLSLFHTPANNNVTIGRDGQLFSWSRVTDFLQYDNYADREYLTSYLDKARTLQDLLQERDIQLFLFLTPAKVRYHYEDLPKITRFLAPDPKERVYDILSHEIPKYDLSCFDSISYIEEHRQEFDPRIPLFYKTGTHWSTYCGLKTAVAFSSWLSSESGYRLPTAEVTAVPVESPDHPDADMFELLNVMEKPYDSYFHADLQILSPETDAPNAVFRGCSFMGQSLSPLIHAGFFGKEAYLENSQYFSEDYSKLVTFSDYSQLDMKQIFADTNMLILEINEISYGPAFTLIDYILEHPDILPEPTADPKEVF